jgi:hypothetical protein
MVKGMVSDPMNRSYAANKDAFSNRSTTTAHPIHDERLIGVAMATVTGR